MSWNRFWTKKSRQWYRWRLRWDLLSFVEEEMYTHNWKKNHNGACQKVCDNVDFRRWKNDQSVPAQKNCTRIKFFPSALNIS